MEMTPNQTVEGLRAIQEYLEESLEDKALLNALNKSLRSAIEYIYYNKDRSNGLFGKDY
tara:strand:+ start:152 stop:328 length:177 start_codon:yes stop_codon:yes gene_type:complete